MELWAAVTVPSGVEDRSATVEAAVTSHYWSPREFQTETV